MAAIFGETNFFLKIWLTTLDGYPVGQKFCQNRSISHDFRDTSLFAFCINNKKQDSTLKQNTI